MTEEAVQEELRGELRDHLVSAMQRVPELAGRELTLTALSGGITNRNFLVTIRGERDRYVIRLAGNDTHLLGISREVEYAATVAAAGVGVGPEVTAYIRPEGYLVTRFIEGSPVSLDEDDVRPAELGQVVGDRRSADAAADDDRPGMLHVDRVSGYSPAAERRARSNAGVAAFPSSRAKCSDAYATKSTSSVLMPCWSTPHIASRKSDTTRISDRRARWSMWAGPS